MAVPQWLMMSLRRRWTVALLCVVCLQFIFLYRYKRETFIYDKCDGKWQRRVEIPTETRSFEKIGQHRMSQTSDDESKVSVKDEAVFHTPQRETERGGEPQLEHTRADESVSSFKNALVFPVPQRKKGFLTIGIPTIKRKGASYVLDTISSLLSNMSPKEKQEVLLVVFLADRDPSFKHSLAEEIRSSYNDCLASGMLHIIQAPANYYPDFSNITKLTYKETKQHVTWRAKQCYDYSYLLEYSVNLSTYYMQLEDDVVASAGFIGSIKEFMEKQPNNFWICLEFSELGFIGKLYRSTDLVQLAALLKLFYIEQPPDYTFIYFNMLSTQLSTRLRKPTLFQHKGITSSLTGKIQRLQDRFFQSKTRKAKADNPPAKIYTSIDIYMTYFPNLAYNDVSEDGYFWSHGPPKEDDTITAVFHEAHHLHRVAVVTGTDFHPKDILHHGLLILGFKVLESENTPKCDGTVIVGEFKNGRIDANNLEEKVKEKVACFVIKVIGNQKDWVIVQDIIVTVANSTTQGRTNAS